MYQIMVIVFIALLSGFTAVAAEEQSSPSNHAKTSLPAHPSLVFGPGPVIEPENSQYMEDKKAEMKKDQKAASDTTTQFKPNPPRRLPHGLIPPAEKQ
ncbi:hypothetical protein [Enterobacter ludwigii]|uniref:hypothetical protein n=1 Tax=Enterobacter ludwigii TaxID=299767 RepID=UPI003976C042